MRNTTLYIVAGFVLIGLALAVDYGLGPVPIAISRLLPVSHFPAQFADWSVSADRPVDPYVQDILPHAIISDRIYTDVVGRTMDLTLVSSADENELHDPLSCFSGQGWQLLNRHTVIIEGQPMTLATAAQDNMSIPIAYWFTGFYLPRPSPNPMVRQLSAMRLQLLGGHLVHHREGQSLLVRVMDLTPNPDPNGIKDFLHDCSPSLNAFINSPHDRLQTQGA